jgi:hypothetical protein
MSEQFKIVKFLKRFFNNPIEQYGIIFEYSEIGIEENFAEAFRFVVNVVLPIEGQSYIAAVLDDIIKDQIYESYKFLGQTYSYSITMTINGQELFPSTYTYIKKDSLSNIMQICNKKFSRIGIAVDFGEGEKPLDMDCRLSWDKFPYDSHDENVNFYIKLELSNFEFDGVKVIANPEKKEDVAGTLFTILSDRDWFNPVIEDIVYTEIIPDTKIDKVDDVYAQVFIRVNRLDGEIVKQKEAYWKIQPDFFIEVS